MGIGYRTVLESIYTHRLLPYITFSGIPFLRMLHLFCESILLGVGLVSIVFRELLYISRLLLVACADD